MAENTTNDTLTKERLYNTTSERHVLAVESIADHLALIRSDLAAISGYVRGSGLPPEGKPEKDIGQPAENWENEGGQLCADTTAEPGITRSMVETFTVGPYRYTDLDHAVAQARRTPMHGAAHG